MTNYTLPSLDSIVGLFSFRLTSEFAGLVVPTIQTIKEIGDTKESADITLGQSEIGNVVIQIRDDYTNYTYGFWYKVLSGETHLRIFLDGTFYFYGIVQPDTVNWDEAYIDGTTRIRTCTFTLLSMASKLFETPTADWLTAAYDNRELTGYSASTPAFAVISLTGLFSALLKASGLNATYDKTDTLFQASTITKDIELFYSGSWYALNFVWLLVTYDSGSGETKVDYFDSTSENFLGTRYPKAQALISAIVQNFGVVFRTEYDVASSRHLVKLLQRGRTYDDADNLDFSNREKQPSVLSKSTDLLGDATRCTGIYTDEEVWFSRKYKGTDFSEAPIENYVKPEIDFYIPFLVNSAAPDVSGYPIYVGSVATSVGIASSVRYYRYDTATTVIATATGARKMLEAVAGYMFSRFTKENSKIVRTYGQMKAKVGTGPDTHISLTVMRRISINDGLGATIYYANSVAKKPKQSEVEIEWLKE